MLFIMIGTGIVLVIIGILIACLKDSDIGFCFIGGGGLIAFVFTIAMFIVLGTYNSVKTTADRQIAVLEEYNETVLTQIEPLVDKYLHFESNTYGNLKPTASTLISMANYPELKGDKFVQEQINTLKENEHEILEHKLDKAKLNAYRLWIFMGE